MQESDSSLALPPFLETTDRIVAPTSFAKYIDFTRLVETLSVPPPTEKINIASFFEIFDIFNHYE